MSTRLKAIETVYNGYRFRSRLEARWAVFFGQMGVPYEYEGQGFDLDKVWYLPDFFIPNWGRTPEHRGTFLEIKPELPRLDGPEVDKCRRLAIASQKWCFLLVGQPWPGEFEIITIDPKDPPNLVGAYNEFAICATCGDLCLFEEPRGQHRVTSRRVVSWYATDLSLRRFAIHPKRTIPWPARNSARLQNAYTAARQARFGT